MRFARSTALASLVLAVVTGVGGCGSDNTSPSGAPAQTSSAQTSSARTTTSQESPGVTAVCAAGTRLSTAMHTVIAEIKAGNLGAARNAVPTVTSAASDLADATSQLKSEESSKLQPQVEALKTQLQQAADAKSAAELRSALTHAGTTASSLASTLRADLQCPS